MTEAKQGGKGRPTPKRAAAVKARKQPVVSPKGRGARGASRAERVSTRRAMREAMRTGDERYLPAIAAGPERAAVRDAVDARRSYGWLAIAIWLAGLVLTLVPLAITRAVGSLAFPVVVVVLVVDSMAAARAVRRVLDKRFPEGTETRRRSLVWYGIARNTQFRRQRLPRPRVERGAEV